MTHDLARRMSEHKGGFVPGFSRMYGVDKRVYFEQHSSILEAREREHRLERRPRSRNPTLIEGMNPAWHDLTELL